MGQKSARSTAQYLAKRLAPLPSILLNYPSQPQETQRQLSTVLDVSAVRLYNPHTTKCALNVAAIVLNEYPHCRSCPLMLSGCPWTPERTGKLYQAGTIQAIIELIPQIQMMIDRAHEYVITHPTNKGRKAGP